MKQGRFAIATVSMILGVMIVMQYRMTQTISAGNVNVQRSSELAQQVNFLTEENDSLLKQLETIKKQGTVEGIKKENEILNMRAGLTEVSGPGVLLTINDSKVPVKNGENPNLYLIHDEDILRIINELRAAGAEAIAINDQRLIGTSEIRCSGPTITVNGKLFTPPFQIRAIGDSKMLKAALMMRGGVIESLSYWGIEVKVQTEQSITIPSYKGSFKSEFMKPVGGS